jgi:hypothetical protein
MDTSFIARSDPFIRERRVRTLRLSTNGQTHGFYGWKSKFRDFGGRKLFPQHKKK